MRISFTGDISLDKPVLHALNVRGELKHCNYVNKNQIDCYAKMLKSSKDVFCNSEFVVGNLETVFGGGTQFNKKTMHYNSPDNFAWALKDVGINVLTTANNHSLDEGREGLERTLDILEQAGFLHTGTFRKEDKNRILYLEKNGIKIAIIAYTYGVNPCQEADECTDLEEVCNLFQPYKKMYAGMSKFEICLRKYIFTRELGRILRIILRKPTVKQFKDKYNSDSFCEEYLDRIKKDLEEAKERGANYTFVCLHSGGQFNEEPGDYTVHVMDAIEKMGNCTAVIANHPHVIQRIEFSKGMFRAYSLGGFSLSPDASYVTNETLPEYSMVLHFDIDEYGYRVSYDLLHNKAEKDGYLVISKVDLEEDKRIDLIKKRIHRTYSQRDLQEFIEIKE